MYCLILSITFTANFPIPVFNSTSHLFNKETQAGYFQLSSLNATSYAWITHIYTLPFFRSDHAFFNFIRFLLHNFNCNCQRECGILKLCSMSHSKCKKNVVHCLISLLGLCFVSTLVSQYLQVMDNI